MADLTFSVPGGFKFSRFSIVKEFPIVDVTSSETEIRFGSDPNNTAYFTGTGFAPNGAGQVPTTGTITHWTVVKKGGMVVDVAGLNLSIADFITFLNARDSRGFLTTILAGADSVFGASGANELWGGGGNDTVGGSLGRDTLRGDAGDDRLNGGNGRDNMYGGLGDDTFGVDDRRDKVTEKVGEGTDTVISRISYKLGKNLENLTLFTHTDDPATPDDAINGFGNELANTLLGNRADNILDGGLGVDIMRGRAGNDIYVVDNIGDELLEIVPVFDSNGNQTGIADTGGLDTILTSVSYTLPDNVENMTATGRGLVNLTGNELNNVLTGNRAVNVLTGGLGDDTYVVQNTADSVVELTGEGTDTVISSVAFVLSENVENLQAATKSRGALVGNAGDNTITGNASGNSLFGAGGNDIINGGSGRDIIVGGAGNDSVTGGIGKDVFVCSLGGNDDTFLDFTQGQDRIDVKVFDLADFAALQALFQTQGADTLLTLGSGLDVNTVLIKDIDPDALTARDFLL